jgi:hypothetical protein
MNHGRRHKKALTLVEALMATLILATVAVAVTHAIVAGQMQVYDAGHRAAAMELAEALMDEVVRLPYQDPGGGAEAGRADFDNLGDYHGFTESAGSLTDVNGVAYAGKYQVFSRTISVVSASRSVAGFGAPFLGVNITVMVTDAAGTTWALDQFVPEPVN